MSDSFTMSNAMPVPAASQSVPLIDTTAWGTAPQWTSTATTPGPGRSRAVLAGNRVTGTISPVGQSVTLRFLLLVYPTVIDNAAFVLDTNVSGTSSTGSVVVAAGATQPFSWLPATPDWRIEVLAGGTAPSNVHTTLIVTEARVSGA